MSKKNNNIWIYLSTIAIITLLLFSIYLIYRFYVTYKANQFNSSSYTPELASIVVFGYKLPPFILPQSIQGVNTESGAYATIISNVLIVAGILLGFYSLVAIESIKSTINLIKDHKKRYNSLTKIVRARMILSVILIAFLITSTYTLFLVSIIDASHASVYQGIVSTAACQIATTVEQRDLALHNITYGEINCQGVTTPLEVSSSSPSLNLSLSTQLQGEVMEINRYESLLFADIKNAGNMLEGAILMLSLLLLAYVIIYSLRKD